MSLRGPTVLEDLHWADEQTVDFIRHLLAEPPTDLAVITTYRGDEAGPDRGCKNNGVTVLSGG
jgi:hypothetical protein